MKYGHWLLVAIVGLGLVACQSVGKPSTKVDFKPLTVTNFEAGRYMGRWYEVARFDFYFQKNLKNVTADYALKKDGSIQVINQGVDLTTGERKRAEGKARSKGPSDRGALEVSFFGPFYSEYNIVQLDGDYRYALVFGKDTDNVWLLSRDKTMPAEVKQAYVEYARKAGFDLSRLIWTQQDQ